MQYSQEHLKTMVYAQIWGANRVYYGQLENRELVGGESSHHLATFALCLQFSLPFPSTTLLFIHLIVAFRFSKFLLNICPQVHR